MTPLDPIAAVTHDDPYPLYAALREGPALAWNAARALWVASRAEVIQASMARPDALRVRPVGEPVPRAIAGGPAGEVFGHLVRMNDGPVHAANRPPLERALAGLDLAAVHASTARIANDAIGHSLSDTLFEIPVRTVAHLLGFADAVLPDVVQWMRAFVACLAPASSEPALEAAARSAAALMDRFEALTAATPAREASLLAGVLAECGGSTRSPPSRALLANLVGLLSQTCDATAGLLGNSLVAMTRHALGREDAFAIVRETARHDPSIQNTRRFVAARIDIGGIALEAGDVVLLVLASANRDPALNPSPDCFAIARSDRRSLGFGHGPHACPGQALACTLAAAGLHALRTAQPDIARSLASRGWRYRPSGNARIPDFQ